MKFEKIFNESLEMPSDKFEKNYKLYKYKDISFEIDVKSETSKNFQWYYSTFNDTTKRNTFIRNIVNSQIITPNQQYIWNLELIYKKDILKFKVVLRYNKNNKSKSFANELEEKIKRITKNVLKNYK